MDVISGELPSGEALGLSNGKGVKVESGGIVNIYVSVDDQKYRVKGPKEYESLMMIMADSITPVEREDE